MKYGYVRVSTERQDTDMQVAALLNAGIPDELIYRDIITGKTTSRDGLDEMLGMLRPGDEVWVWKTDRLGRRVSHLAALVDSFIERKIKFISLTEHFDLATPMGKAMLGMAMVFAELERNNTSERTKTKLAHLRANGTKLGRPPIYEEKYAEVIGLVNSGMGYKEVAAATGMSKPNVAKIMKRHRNPQPTV